MNVLHLIDPGSPGGGGCTLRLLAESLARLTSVRQDVLIVGHERHVELARRCGVEPIGSIGAPVRQAVLARGGLVRALRMQERGQGSYDLIHAWTLPSAVLAATAAPRRRRLATFTVGPLCGLATPLLRAIVQRDATPIIATSRSVAREYASIGIDEDAITIIPPAVNPESTPLGDRASQRRAWHVDDSTFVVGLLSEPLRWADARVAADVVLQVAATGRSVRLLVHHAATRRGEAERWLAGLGLRDLMIVDDAAAEPWRVARGLDAALLVGGELNALDLSAAGSPFAALTGGGRRMLPLPSGLPLLWAMVAGVPVIADASDVATDVIVEGESGLLITPYDRNAAADRIMRLYDDPTIAGRIGLQARRHVADAFGVSAYCVRLKEAYVQAVNGTGTTPATPDVRHADPAVTPVAVG